MDVQSFYRQMADYVRWKSSLSTQLSAFLCWYKTYQPADATALRCLRQALQTLNSDSFLLVLVGEVSRGKTELINALLYPQYDCKLLPSGPGRTTMCPTEIYYDPLEQANVLRLLPIETRRSSATLTSFRRIPKHWVSVPLDSSDPTALAAALQRLAQVKRVTTEEAHALGFDLGHLKAASDGLWEIPAWRHALLNMDHPLLRHGLRLLDTPGLNVLGNEPELTLSNLPDADSILFMLAADIGLSASDTQIWRDHIKPMAEETPERVLVLLNKMDNLWGEASGDQAQVSANVRASTARALRMSEDQVLTLSARQALQAQQQPNEELLQFSHLPQIEQQLAQQLIRNQEHLSSSVQVTDAIQVMQNTRKLMKERLERARQEREQLRKVLDSPAQSAAQINSLRQQVRHLHQLYRRQSLDLRAYQRELERRCEAMRVPMAAFHLEGLINATYEEMLKSWTFVGLGRVLGKFFEQLHQRSDRLRLEVQAANESLLRIYENARYHRRNPQEALARRFDLQPYQRQLGLLEQQAREFRRSLVTMLGLRRHRAARFMHTLGQEVRTINNQLQEKLDGWVESAMTPMLQETEQQKETLDSYLKQMTQLRQQRSEQWARVQELKQELAVQEAALSELDHIITSAQATPAAPLPDGASLA
ncbi:dynamin family protein [Pseudomaricurvus sp. HS19]|uniref:dynamin family protein n=1 Tax=Pseudomaricurvus sp. HS19 TaxID=2692626 RepID=UPI001367F3A3|nr:hypothetical protein [Pseudomaricurvus sp. HS19]